MPKKSLSRQEVAIQYLNTQSIVQPTTAICGPKKSAGLGKKAIPCNNECDIKYVVKKLIHSSNFCHSESRVESSKSCSPIRCHYLSQLQR